MIRYLISDGTAARDPDKWLNAIAYWIEAGLDCVQIREPDLDARRLADLTRRVVQALPPVLETTRILVNDRADIALASGAHGVHMRDGSVEARRIRGIASKPVVVSVACHDFEGVLNAANSDADYILLAPVFAPLSKTTPRRPLGLDKLREAARSVRAPVIALGGVTQANAQLCIEAGAAGVAGISLFKRD